MFLDTIGNILHVNFLVYANWFMSISISQMKDHSISLDQAIYDTSILDKYLYTYTFKTSKKLYKTNLSSGMVLIKYDVSTSDEQVEKFNS